MQDWDSIQVLSQLAITSEYFLQVTLDKDGRVLSSDPGIGPAPSLFDYKEKPIYFSDCFLSSDWSKFESQRMKAWKGNHNSFLIELKKINHPDNNYSPTKWEFFFISKDYGTCLGIGHPLVQSKPYHVGLGEFLEGSAFSSEVLEGILENKLLGFWEYDPKIKQDTISPQLAHVLGYAEEEIKQLGKIHWKKHIHPEDAIIFSKEIKKHFLTPGSLPLKIEFRLIVKGNQTSWAMAYAQTVDWDENGMPLKIQGVLLDVNEKKRQELWLREHHYFLKELAFQQSHSLRARVANILGVLEILDMEQHNTESKKMINILKKETQMLDSSLKKSIKDSVQHHQYLQQGLETED